MGPEGAMAQSDFYELLTLPFYHIPRKADRQYLRVSQCHSDRRVREGSVAGGRSRSARAMQLALEASGYAVDPAATIREAQGCLAAITYGLMITDWRLPDWPWDAFRSLGNPVWREGDRGKRFLA